MIYHVVYVELHCLSNKWRQVNYVERDKAEQTANEDLRDTWDIDVDDQHVNDNLCLFHELEQLSKSASQQHVE